MSSRFGGLVPPDLVWQPDLTSRAVTPARIEAIAFTPMPAKLRNELITQAYGDLAQAMAGLLGTADATWAGFGQWASSTVGPYLDLPVPGLGLLIGRAFGDGNRDVFADIGRAHATFLETVGRAYHDGGDLRAAWRDCEAQLRLRLFSPPGGPDGGTEDEFWASLLDPRSVPGRRHNELLVIAFRAYYRALGVVDPEQRSRLILLGNCMVGLHEQRLLAFAISVGFRSWLRTLTTPWRLLQSRYAWRHRYPGRGRIALENWWIRFATGHLLAVALPTGPVRMGRPVPAGERPIAVERLPLPPPGDGGTLATVSPDTLLGKAFTRFDVDGRASRCWNLLPDRMAYIMALFAGHQRSGYWFDTAGRVVRPVPWTGFERELARQVTAMTGGTPPRPAVMSPSPLDDAALDRLRARPTHLPLAPADATTLDVGGVRGRRAYQPLVAEVAQRYARASRPGGLLDPDLCRAAHRSFRRWSTLWFMGLVFRSLPDSYSAAIGAHVLGEVSDLATHAFRRAGQTAFFVIDLLGTERGWDGGVMAREGPAFRSVAGVRIMHSVVASRLLQDGWDEQAHGIPLNAEDALGAALCFGVSPVEMLLDLGIDLPADVRDHMVRFWLGVGHLMGVPEEALSVAGPSGRVPFDFEQARALSHAVRDRHLARSLDGVRLTEALVTGVADGFPRPAGWMSPGLMLVLGDPQVTTALLVDSSGGRFGASLLATGFRFLLRHRVLRPAARMLIGAIGRIWLRPFLEQGRDRPFRRPLEATEPPRPGESDDLPNVWPISCGGRAVRPR